MQYGIREFWSAPQKSRQIEYKTGQSCWKAYTDEIGLFSTCWNQRDRHTLNSLCINTSLTTGNAVHQTVKFRVESTTLFRRRRWLLQEAFSLLFRRWVVKLNKGIKVRELFENAVFNLTTQFSLDRKRWRQKQNPIFCFWPSVSCSVLIWSSDCDSHSPPCR